MNDITIDIQEICTLHGEIIGLVRTSLEKGIRIGELLLGQKSILSHGEFTPWIIGNLPFSDRTARNYIRLYKNRDLLKTETVSDLKSAYRLLSHPAEEDERAKLAIFEERSQLIRGKVDALKEEWETLKDQGSLENVYDFSDRAERLYIEAAEHTLRAERELGRLLRETGGATLWGGKYRE